MLLLLLSRTRGEIGGVLGMSKQEMHVRFCVRLEGLGGRKEPAAESMRAPSVGGVGRVPCSYVALPPDSQRQRTRHTVVSADLGAARRAGGAWHVGARVDIAHQRVLRHVSW